MRHAFAALQERQRAIPWLFREPDGALLEWRARFNSYLHASTSEQQRLQAALTDPRCSKAAAERIKLVAEGEGSTDGGRSSSCSAPLGLDAPRNCPALDRAGVLHAQAAAPAGPSQLLRQYVPRLGLEQRRERAVARLPRASAGTAARVSRRQGVDARRRRVPAAVRLSSPLPARRLGRARSQSAARVAREPRAARPPSAVLRIPGRARSTKRRSRCCATARRRTRRRRTSSRTSGCCSATPRSRR